MKQDRDQNQVLLWTATATLFLFVLFRLRILENIGYSPYIPFISAGLLLAQWINHEQATIALRKKSPNFTNNFYAENGRMILGNVVASALVLELNIFNYEHSNLNFCLELIAIPIIAVVIFLIENSQGGFLALNRIYFPKKWDQFFKSYGVDILSISLMIAMWMPVMFKIPVSAMLWIIMSTLLLKASVTYTNKYNHIGWCFLFEILLVLHLLTLGLQDSRIWLLVLGILVGILFLAMYLPKMGFEKFFVGMSILLFVGGVAALYYYSHGEKTIVYYLQREIGLLLGIMLINKIGSLIYRKLRKKEEANKYSYEGAIVNKSFQQREHKGFGAKIAQKKEESVALSRRKTIVLKKTEVKSQKGKKSQVSPVKQDKTQKTNFKPVKQPVTKKVVPKAKAIKHQNVPAHIPKKLETKKIVQKKKPIKPIRQEKVNPHTQAGIKTGTGTKSKSAGMVSTRGNSKKKPYYFRKKKTKRL